MARGGALSTGYSFSRMCGLRHLGDPWVDHIYVYAGVTRGSAPSSFSQMQLNTSRSDYRTSSLGITLSVLREFSRPPEVATGPGVSPRPLLGLSLCLTSQNSTGAGKIQRLFFPTIQMIIGLLQLCTIQVSAAWSASLLSLPR